MLLLHVGSGESGMTDRATEGLLIRICPSLVRSFIPSSERDTYECDDVSPDARFGRRSDHKSHTSNNVSRQDFAGLGVSRPGAEGHAGF
jgi:hypothetical protein